MAMAAIAGEKAEGKAEHMTFEGQMVCLGCDLKKADGARAECTEFGHAHALKTTDGKYISFLPNKYSKDLLQSEKYDTKTISVHGIYHADANVLDVETFTAVGKERAWCSGCKSMDACMVSKQ